MAPNPHNVSTIVLVVGIQKPFIRMIARVSGIRCSRVVGEKLEPADNARVIPTSQFPIVFVVRISSRVIRIE